MVNKFVTVDENNIFPEGIEARFTQLSADANNYADEKVAELSTEVDNLVPGRKPVAHVVLALGQSNMAGFGTPTNAVLDPTHPRIYQYGAVSRALTLASEPLDMPPNPSTGNQPTGMGPALQFARNMLADLPENDVIVIIPAAIGSTSLIGTGVNDWQWNGTAGNLSADAVQQTNEAIQNAGTRWPGHEVKVSAYLWHQGETDGTSGVSMQDYLTALGNLIAGFRATLGDAPFIIGQMAPAGMGSGTRRAINEAHSRAPYVFERVAFATAEPNLSDGSNTHFTGPGQRKLAKEYYRVYKRVIGKLAPDTPIMPVGGVLPVNQDEWVIQTGVEIFADDTNLPVQWTVTFPKPFGGTPVVFTEGHINFPGSAVNTYAAVETPTSFLMRARANGGDATPRNLKWIAFGPKYEG